MQWRLVAAILGMVIAASLGVAIWSSTPTWQVTAAFVQTLTGLGILATSYLLWNMESKRDATDFSINVLETEQSLFKDSHLRVQLEVMNKGLRGSALEKAEMRLRGGIGDTGWRSVSMKHAFESSDVELMVNTGTKKRIEVYWHDVYKVIPRDALVNLDVSVRITPVLGKPIEIRAEPYRPIA